MKAICATKRRGKKPGATIKDLVLRAYLASAKDGAFRAFLRKEFAAPPRARG